MSAKPKTTALSIKTIYSFCLLLFIPCFFAYSLNLFLRFPNTVRWVWNSICLSEFQKAFRLILPLIKEWNRINFSLKIKNLHFVQKSLLQKIPTHLIWNENIYIFPTFSKKLKNICSHLLWSENAKIFPENWRKK